MRTGSVSHWKNRDNGVESQSPGESTTGRPERKQNRSNKLVNLAIRALRAKDPPEVRIAVALQLLRQIKRMNRYGQIPHRDAELMIQVQISCGDWYCSRWIDYYRGCLYGSLIPLRTEWGQLVSEVPADRLNGIHQAVYSRSIINIRHIWENQSASAETVSTELLEWARSTLA